MSAIYSDGLIYGEGIYSNDEAGFAGPDVDFERVEYTATLRRNHFQSTTKINGIAVTMYRWDVILSGEIIHTYAASNATDFYYNWPATGGDYTIRLRVTDAAGNTGFKERVYTVIPAGGGGRAGDLVPEWYFDKPKKKKKKIEVNLVCVEVEPEKAVCIVQVDEKDNNQPEIMVVSIE